MVQSPMVKKLALLKMSLILILFFGALSYENAQPFRTAIYIILFAIYVGINLFRVKTENNNIKFIMYLIEIGIIYVMETNSRYLVNYIFHLFYFLTLLDIPLNINRRYSLILSTTIILVSSIKFGILIYNKPIFGNLTQSLFFVSTGIFIMLLMNFLKYYKDEKDNKEKLNKELIEAEAKLRKAAVVEERNRIARDIHDTIGHSMTGTIMGLEMVQVLIDEDISGAKAMIEHLKDSARENLVKVREVVSTLNPDENMGKGIDSIKELIESFTAKSNICINFQVKGQTIRLSPLINIVVYRTIQEGLTNAIRHGNPSTVDISIELINEALVLEIKDDGVGCPNIVKGFGLKGMEERITSVGGSIIFSSEDGFQILVNIPREVKND